MPAYMLPDGTIYNGEVYTNEYGQTVPVPTSGYGSLNQQPLTYQNTPADMAGFMPAPSWADPALAQYVTQSYGASNPLLTGNMPMDANNPYPGIYGQQGLAVPMDMMSAETAAFLGAPDREWDFVTGLDPTQADWGASNLDWNDPNAASFASDWGWTVPFLAAATMGTYGYMNPGAVAGATGAGTTAVEAAAGSELANTIAAYESWVPTAAETAAGAAGTGAEVAGAAGAGTDALGMTQVINTPYGPAVSSVPAGTSSLGGAVGGTGAFSTTPELWAATNPVSTGLSTGTLASAAGAAGASTTVPNVPKPPSTGGGNNPPQNQNTTSNSTVDPAMMALLGASIGALGSDTNPAVTTHAPAESVQQGMKDWMNAWDTIPSTYTSATMTAPEMVNTTPIQPYMANMTAPTMQMANTTAPTMQQVSTAPPPVQQVSMNAPAMQQLNTDASQMYSQYMPTSLDLGRIPGTIDQTYSQEFIDAALRPITEQYTEQIMPGINSDAILAGGKGGSRQGVAEGIATRGYMNTMADTTAQMYQDLYNRNLDYMLSAAGINNNAAIAENQAAQNMWNEMLGYTTNATSLNNAAALNAANYGINAANANNMANLNAANYGLNAVNANNASAMNAANYGLNATQVNNAANLNAANYGLSATQANNAALVNASNANVNAVNANNTANQNQANFNAQQAWNAATYPLAAQQAQIAGLNSMAGQWNTTTNTPQETDPLVAALGGAIAGSSLAGTLNSGGGFANPFGFLAPIYNTPTQTPTT